MKLGRASIAVVLLAGACERAGNGTKQVELPIPTITVKLVDPGAEPRQEIRVKAVAGAHGVFDFKEQGAITSPARRAMPDRTCSYETKVVEVSPDGIRHLREEITAASDDLGRGLVFDEWRDARGMPVRPLAITMPSDKNLPENGGRPEHMVIAPVEPVGVGARWHEDIEDRGTTASVDIELLSRDGDRLRERCVYHVSSTFDGRRSHRDGTSNGEFSLTEARGTAHDTYDMTIEDPHGTVRGSFVSEMVLRP